MCLCTCTQGFAPPLFFFSKILISPPPLDQFLNEGLVDNTGAMILNLHKFALGYMYEAKHTETAMIHIIEISARAHVHTLTQVFSLGYVEETTNVIVNGIVESIKLAHENMVLGQLYLNSGVLYNASINRSPTAYLLNPLEEREK